MQENITTSINIELFKNYIKGLDHSITKDIRQTDADTDWLVINEKTKNIEALKQFTKLESIYVIGADESMLNFITSLKHLKNLQLGYAKTADLSALKKNNHIQVLLLNDCHKLTSLKGVEKLTALQVLSIENSKKITTLDEIAKLKNLLHFDLSGGNYESVKVFSLKPLAKLTGLEGIHLVNTRVTDEDLSALKNLQQLKKLFLPNNFPTEEYAKLSVYLPDTYCNLFEACTPLSIDEVMITGKRKPFLNREKDEKRIENYRKKFKAMQQEEITKKQKLSSATTKKKK